MRILRALAALPVLFCLPQLRASGGGSELPETLPNCNYPQPFNAPQSLGDAGGSAGSPPALAWNGTDYGSLSVSNYFSLRFQKVFADGSPAPGAVALPYLPLGVTGSLYPYERSALAWSGSGYGTAWIYYDNALSHYLVAFAALSADGSAAGPVQRASFVGVAPTADASTVSVAYNSYSGKYAVVWADSRSGTADIYLTVFDGAGNLSNATAHDILISRTAGNLPLAGNQQSPRIASSPIAGPSALIVWQDGRAVPAQIYGRTLSLFTDGTPGYFGTEYQLTNAASGAATSPALAATPTGYGLAWQDTRNGPAEIYSARLDGNYGNRIGAETRVTNTPGMSGYLPAIAWTGSEFGVAWFYYNGASSDLWFARVSATGAALSSPAQVITGWLGSSIAPTEVAFGRYGFVAGLFDAYAGHYAVAVGCNYDYTAPACSGNLQVSAANWNSATFSWDAVTDPDNNDMAYYELFKDGQSAGRTSGTQLTLTGLAPGAASNYELYPVDANQRRPAGCPVLAFTAPQQPNQCPASRTLSPGSAFGAAGGQISSSTSLAANSTDFALAYVDYQNRVYFQRYYPDGRPLAAPVQVAQAAGVGYSYAPGLVWNGSGYGIAWYGGSNFFFAKLDANGAVISAPVSLNIATGTPPTYQLYGAVMLAWNGTNYAAVWEDYRNSGTTGLDVYATVLKADGTLAGPVATPYSDIVISNGAGDQRYPAITWSPGAGRFVIALAQNASTPASLQTVRLDPSTGLADAPSTVITSPGGANRPSIATDGYYLAITWQDGRYGSGIFWNLLPSNGIGKYYNDVLLSTPGVYAYNSSIVNSFGYGDFNVVWNDGRDGNQRIYLQRVNYSSLIGGNIPVSPAGLNLQIPRLVFSSQGILVAAPQASSPFGQSYLYSLGCPPDPSPPVCPANLAITASSATSVGLGWSASTDGGGGVDHYVIVRNGGDVGSTTNTAFTDTVAAGGTYSYAVQPVNWAGTRNSACAQSVSVTTPAIPGACVQPQAGAPGQPLGGGKVSRGTPIVWNGAAFAVVWKDDNDGNLYFEKLYADGRPIAGSRVTVITGLGVAATYGPGLVWNGAGYGVAYFSDTTKLYYFALLDAGGALIGSPTAVSSSAQTTPYYSGNTWAIGLATSGAGYAVVWEDSRNNATTQADINATLLKADGTIDGPAGVWHDLVISNAANDQVHPTIAWSAYDGTGRYLIAYEDAKVAPVSIFGSRLNPADGTFTAPFGIVTGSNINGAYEPTLVSANSPTTGLGLAWIDSRDSDTSNAVYFTRLAPYGGRLTGDIRETLGNIGAYHPSLVWNGAEYGVFWNDSHTGASQIWYQRIDGGGNPAGVPAQVSNAAELHIARAAWGPQGYLVTSNPYNNDLGGLNMVHGLACQNDTTPATCPGNLLAYNVSGTQATISWSPAGDPESGIAEYVLYRNNAELARTTATVYTDLGLGLSTPYNYMVQPVNGRGVQNNACVASVYVKTSASLTLTLGKSTPDALLNWTDAGLNNYTIFRGNNPQVMTLIGATPALSAPDPNVLSDGFSYFYTVDDPGQ
jgi:hypothetical protein